MSDTTVSTGGAPAIVLDPSTSKPLPAASTPPPAAKTDGKPEWLDARLAEATASGQAKVLKALGVESMEDAKKAFDRIKAADDAAKSDAQKAADFESALKTERAEKAAITEALSSYAKAQMAALTDAQRAAVAAVSGEDPAKQLKSIEALKPTWASAAAPAAPVADTAPAKSAPSDAGSSSSPPDLKAIHAEMLKTNPIVAARFALENRLFENQ